MDGWVWSNGGMILTGETEVLGEKHYTVWVVDGWMGMGQWWNDTERESSRMGDRDIARSGEPCCCQEHQIALKGSFELTMFGSFRSTNFKCSNKQKVSNNSFDPVKS
jgi:hypothetical protein